MSRLVLALLDRLALLERRDAVRAALGEHYEDLVQVRKDVLLQIHEKHPEHTLRHIGELTYQGTVAKHGVAAGEVVVAALAELIDEQNRTVADHLLTEGD